MSVVPVASVAVTQCSVLAGKSRACHVVMHKIVREAAMCCSAALHLLAPRNSAITADTLLRPQPPPTVAG
jgi:hypothetical protein